MTGVEGMDGASTMIAPARMGSARRKVALLNVAVDDVTMDEVVEGFREGALLTLHTDMLVKLQKDRAFYDAFRQFDLVTCDSQILYVAARLLGTPLSERVSGSDFFPRFCQHHKDNPEITVFLCGGKPGIAEIAARNINERVGREIVVGTDAPAFDFDTDPAETARMIAAINASGATVLLVGLGGGRQEKFIVENRHRMPGVRLFLPLGGTIDYEAKTLRRPPGWVTDWGLEWFARLLQRPGTYWRRYIIEDTPMLWLLVKQRLGLYRDPFGT